MPALDETIDDWVIGDARRIAREVELDGFDDGELISQAIMTCKARESDADNVAIFQKIITTSDSPDGVISDDGAASGIAKILFRVSAANTATWLANKTYYYDIQVRSGSSDPYTPEKGRIRPIAPITLS